jgi:hypothetical protein
MTASVKWTDLGWRLCLLSSSAIFFFFFFFFGEAKCPYSYKEHFFVLVVL